MRFFLGAALSLLSSTLVAAQTYTDCNPTQRCEAHNHCCVNLVTNNQQHVPLILHLANLTKRSISQVAHLMLSSRPDPSHTTRQMVQPSLFLSRAMAR